MMGLITLVTMSVNCFSLTYTKDIRPIFEKRCSQCHNPSWDKGNWLSYDRAYKKRFMIRDRIQSGSMPPFGFDMDKAERKNIIDWVNEGAVK